MQSLLDGEGGDPKQLLVTFLGELEARAELRELYAECFGTGKYVVISSPVRFVPVELEREIAYLDLPLPDLGELLSPSLLVRATGFQ